MLRKGVSERVGIEAEKQQGRFLGMFTYASGATLLVNMLAGKCYGILNAASSSN